MRARIGAAIALTVATAAVFASAGTSKPPMRMLYGCAYPTNLGSSTDVNVLIWDKSAPGARGWVTFDGSGVNKTTKFTLDSFGWHTEKFNVMSFDTEHIKVGLYKPKLNYSFDYTLNSTTDVTKKSCKPK